MTPSKSILELTSKEAKKFFLKQESYCNIDLPNYINFQDLLDALSKEIANKQLQDICKKWKDDKPTDHDDLNHVLLSNKDGRFSWRPLKLIHPALYVLLVHRITNQENWEVLKKRFSNITKKVHTKIECKSLPRVSTGEESDKAAQVSNWWSEIEQESLKLSLEFSCVIHADVADCYGSIYTHSIPWAIHGKKIAKHKDRRHDMTLIGNVIDATLQSMSYGQTNGIPQGSILMDFIAETILAYADLKVYLQTPKVNYKIIRYRDDYRIFTESESDGLKILKVLTEVLSDLSMRLNASKTVVSDNLIRESIKPDKWHLLDNTMTHRGFQKQLLFIHKLSGLFPNAGSIRKELFVFYKKLHKKKMIKQDITVLISIVSDIAFRNPTTYPSVSAILSKLLSFLEEASKIKLLNKILKRFEVIPNTGLLDIWLQRIAIANGSANDVKFKESLCKIILDPTGIKNDVIWNSSWLNSKVEKIVQNTKIIDIQILSDLEPIVSIDEIALFQMGY